MVILNKWYWNNCSWDRNTDCNVNGMDIIKIFMELKYEQYEVFIMDIIKILIELKYEQYKVFIVDIIKI